MNHCISVDQRQLFRWKYPRVHGAWIPVWSFHSQWRSGLPCHLLVLVHSFLKSSQCSPQPRHSRVLDASLCPHCQRYQKLVQWPWSYCAWLASLLPWHEPHREPLGCCQEEDERHQPSIEFTEMNILFRSLIFLLKTSFFDGLLQYSNFLRHSIVCFQSLSHNHKNDKKWKQEIFHSVCHKCIWSNSFTFWKDWQKIFFTIFLFFETYLYYSCISMKL